MVAVEEIVEDSIKDRIEDAGRVREEISNVEGVKDLIMDMPNVRRDTVRLVAKKAMMLGTVSARTTGD